MEYKLLIETSNPADIALIRSLLDAEGILYYVQGEGFHAVRPMVQPTRFLVANDRLEEAQELLSNLRLSYGPMTSTPRDDGSDD